MEASPFFTRSNQPIRKLKWRDEDHIAYMTEKQLNLIKYDHINLAFMDYESEHQSSTLEFPCILNDLDVFHDTLIVADSLGRLNHVRCKASGILESFTSSVFSILASYSLHDPNNYTLLTIQKKTGQDPLIASYGRNENKLIVSNSYGQVTYEQSQLALMRVNQLHWTSSSTILASSQSGELHLMDIRKSTLIELTRINRQFHY